MNNKGKQLGFTLTEMMVTIAIAGILLGAAIPSFQAIFLKNTTIAYTDDFKMALYLAQSEAVKRNTNILIAPKTTGNDIWEDGWNIFIDGNSNNTFESADDELIRTYTPSANNYRLESSLSGFDTGLAFNSLGEPSTSSGTASGVEFWVCGQNSNDSQSRRTVTVSFAGSIIVKEGATCP